MKFREIYNLEHMMLEYGMSSSGPPTPVASQQMGSTAKATAQQRPQQPAQSASPTTQPAAASAPRQQPTVAKASDLRTGDQFAGPDDTEFTVVSAAGSTSPEVPGDTPASIVVRDQAGQMYEVEPDTEVAVPQAVEESVYAKFDRLSLQEQLQIISKLDKHKLNEIWSKLQHTAMCESEELGKVKQTIISLIQDTDEETLLHRVLKTLEAGNLDDRVSEVLKTDDDAAKFVNQITSSVLAIDAPIEEKTDFLDRYSSGIIDTSKLLSGSEHSFGELVGSGFAEELFVDLSQRLASQGVGPGEIALAVFSPEIRWSGRAGGGGDIIVNSKHIEVKAGGGRWLDARKAKMNMPAIKEAVESATGTDIPDRMSASSWVSNFRPLIDQADLPQVCKAIAKGLFSAADTANFEEALRTASASEITEEQLRTGYENYKKLSGFDTMLLIDIPKRAARHFESYEEMKGNIGARSGYLYGPESEAMHKVFLKATSSVQSPSPKTTKADNNASTALPQPTQTRKANRVAREIEPQTAGELGRAKVENQNVNEAARHHFLKPGELRGSWRDSELRKLGFKQTQQGHWYVGADRWHKLSQLGERNWRTLLPETDGLGESVPDNDASTVLRRLLSQPLLSGDIRSQMEAYIALPDPNLILHFRKIRGEQGDNVDLRDVLRRYARERLHPKVQQQLGLA